MRSWSQATQAQRPNVWLQIDLEPCRKRTAENIAARKALRHSALCAGAQSGGEKQSYNLRGFAHRLAAGSLRDRIRDGAYAEVSNSPLRIASRWHMPSEYRDRQRPDNPHLSALVPSATAIECQRVVSDSGTENGRERGGAQGAWRYWPRIDDPRSGGQLSA